MLPEQSDLSVSRSTLFQVHTGPSTRGPSSEVWASKIIRQLPSISPRFPDPLYLKKNYLVQSIIFYLDFFPPHHSPSIHNYPVFPSQWGISQPNGISKQSLKTAFQKPANWSQHLKSPKPPNSLNPQKTKIPNLPKPDQPLSHFPALVGALLQISRSSRILLPHRPTSTTHILLLRTGRPEDAKSAGNLEKNPFINYSYYLLKSNGKTAAC